MYFYKLEDVMLFLDELNVHLSMNDLEYLL